MSTYFDFHMQFMGKRIFKNYKLQDKPLLFAAIQSGRVDLSQIVNQRNGYTVRDIPGWHNGEIIDRKKVLIPSS